MNRVIQINREKLPKEVPIMFVYGSTLRALHLEMGGNPEYLFDTDGTPVLCEEYYQITSEGIKRL